MKKVSFVIGLLREFDVKSKGVGSKAEPEKELLKELLVRILT
jgi:DNA polymerase-3 subunit delta